MPEHPLRPEADPLTLFRQWLSDAERSEPNDPNAVAVATATARGTPSLRMVLLKGLDPRGFVFYTNKQSRKGEELSANRQAALLFHWKTLQRQVRVEGPVEDVTDAEADTYLASRWGVWRVGAIASPLSPRLARRGEVQGRLAELEARYPDEAVPRPAHWSGYRVLPERIEFWQDMPYRLHDRMVYRRDAEGGWQTSRLYP